MSRRKVGRKLDLIITADGGVWERERQSGEPQAKQGAPLKHDWIAITTEAAFREANATKKQRNKSILAEARSMRVWCGRYLHKRPSITDLREIIKTVRRRLRQPD